MSAFFGQKDYQQSLVIRRLVRDLNIPVRIEVCPTVREPDGLALSSRNAYLDAERARARPALNRALGAAEQVAADGGGRDAGRAAPRWPSSAPPESSRSISRSCARTTSPRRRGSRASARLAIAAQVGPARLIDNTLIELPVPASARAGALAG